MTCPAGRATVWSGEYRISLRVDRSPEPAYRATALGAADVIAADRAFRSRTTEMVR